MSSQDDHQNSMFRLGRKKSNAWLEYSGEINTAYIMAGAYYDGFLVIFNELKKTQYSKVDSLAYPLFFLARHCFELYLKCFLKFSYAVKNKKYSLNIHGHLELYHNVDSELLRTINEFQNSEIETVKRMAEDFDHVDQSGAVFKYPSTTKGDPHFENPELWSVEIVRKKMSEIYNIFQRWFYVIDQLFDRFQHLGCTENLMPWEIAGIARLFNGSCIELDKERVYEEFNKGRSGTIAKSEFEVAIKKIREARLLSPHLGVFKSLLYLTNEDIEEITKIHREYQKIGGFDSEGDYTPWDINEIGRFVSKEKELFIKLVAPIFGLNKKCDILAVYDFGREYSWDERIYSSHYSARLLESNQWSIDSNDYDPLNECLSRPGFLDSFYRGLEKLGILCLI